MASKTVCKHTEWIGVAGRGASSVARQTGRLRSLVRSLPSPSSQTPGVCLFTEPAGATVWKSWGVCTTAAPGTIHAHLDPQTATLQNPLFVATAFPVRPGRRVDLHKGYRCCSTIGQHALEESLTATDELVRTRLLFPFVDIFGFVCRDSSDVEDIAQTLSVLDTVRRTLPADCVLPEVIVALVGKAARGQQVSGALADRIAQLSPHLVPRCFSALTFSEIECGQLTSCESEAQLRNCLRDALGRVRSRRAERGLLFSAKHLMALIEVAFDHLPRAEPFDFIEASRLKNPVATDLTQHLASFADRVGSARDLMTFAAETIASSLVLDHCLPRMHGAPQGPPASTGIYC